MSEKLVVQAPAHRWLQLIIGIICMVMIANLQYGWTLFVNPIDQKYHWATRRDPGGVQHVRADRDLVGADRGLVRRSLRAAKIVVLIGGVLVGDRLGDEFLRRLADGALHRRR